MTQTVIDIAGARTWTAVQSVTTAVVHCDRWYQRLRAELRPWRLPQAVSLFVGRVCGESEGARLSEGDLLLEGSLASSSGARVALDLSRLPAFRLFPGQARPPQTLRRTLSDKVCCPGDQSCCGSGGPVNAAVRLPCAGTHWHCAIPASHFHLASAAGSVG